MYHSHGSTTIYRVKPKRHSHLIGGRPFLTKRTLRIAPTAVVYIDPFLEGRCARLDGGNAQVVLDRKRGASAADIAGGAQPTALAALAALAARHRHHEK
jgi:hypothetical protein